MYIVDRIKNRILHRNGWIYPIEIEGELLKWSEIKHVCVIGISNEPLFEIPAAVVVRANASRITEDDVHQFVEGNEYFFHLLFELRKKIFQSFLRTQIIWTVAVN